MKTLTDREARILLATLVGDLDNLRARLPQCDEREHGTQHARDMATIERHMAAARSRMLSMLARGVPLC